MSFYRPFFPKHIRSNDKKNNQTYNPSCHTSNQEKCFVCFGISEANAVGRRDPLHCSSQRITLLHFFSLILYSRSRFLFFFVVVVFFVTFIRYRPFYASLQANRHQFEFTFAPAATAHTHIFQRSIEQIRVCHIGAQYKRQTFCETTSQLLRYACAGKWQIAPTARNIKQRKSERVSG